MLVLSVAVCVSVGSTEIAALSGSLPPALSVKTACMIYSSNVAWVVTGTELASAVLAFVIAEV